MSTITTINASDDLETTSRVNINTNFANLNTDKAEVGQTFYIGTTQVAINRSSAGLTLAGITLTAPVLGVATATSINGLTLTASVGTLTIANNASAALVTSGNFSITLTASGTTSVTLPTSGTLSTLAGSEEFTNKTLNASVGKGTWTASGTWTLPAFTIGGLLTMAANIQFGENTEIILDTVLSADGKYCGITEVVTAGETIAFGELVYLKAADSQWYLCDADADATAGAVRVAIAVTAGTDNNTMTILTYGKIRADAKFPALTVGAPVYISITAGAVQTAQPSGTDDVIRIVGYGNTGDELFFCPSNDYMTHT